METDVAEARLAERHGRVSGVPRADAWSFYRVIEMWSSVFASQQYSMPMSQLGQSRRTKQAAASPDVRFTSDSDRTGAVQ